MNDKLYRNLFYILVNLSLAQFSLNLTALKNLKRYISASYIVFIHFLYKLNTIVKNSKKKI